MRLVFVKEDTGSFVETNHCSSTSEKELRLASSLDERAAAEAVALCLLKSVKEAMRFAAE